MDYRCKRLELVMSDTKPCIICKKPLESVWDDWDHCQPADGGEVQFIFSYGSRKFDTNIDATVFQGVICDDCAEKLVVGMRELS